MNNLVIVAIPDENDRVWKVSSEKIPHLTVLFLGDADKAQNLEQIVQFVEHAANTTLRRFHLSVDRRGELGEDEADVLFFTKSSYDYKAIRDFRANLLKDANIRTAYDSTTQFEGPWKPHLTLGYPGSPAKPEDESYPFYAVGFNKIAVWTDDYDGPDFLLKDYWDEMEALDTVPMDVAMSSMNEVRVAEGMKALDSEELEHYGTKGMKWGVRKQDIGGGGHIRISNRTNMATISNRSSAPLVIPILGFATFMSPRTRAEYKAAGAHNKLVKEDKKWNKQIKKSKRAVDVHNTAADEINTKLKSFNNDKRWKGVDLTKDPAKQKVYDDAAMKELLNPAYARAAVKIYGSQSPSGRYKFEIKDLDTATLKVRDTLRDEVEHAVGDDEEIEVSFTIVRDGNGHILGFRHEDEETEMAQSVDLGEEFVSSLFDSESLEHYGVKGMRWGVSRADRGAPVAVSPRASSVVPHGTKRKTKIETEGGENHPASDDAIKVAAATTKLKKSGVKSLSNQELQEVARRLQLEGQVKQLTAPAGKKFITNLLKTQGQQEVTNIAKSQIRKKVKG